MSLFPEQQQELVRSGLAFVCATCDHYARAVEQQGNLRTECLSFSMCGGPLMGRTFPLYKGELTDKSQRCFVCGDVASFGIKPGGSMEAVGCCQKHMDTLVVPTLSRQGVHMEAASPTQGLIAVDSLKRKAPKRLSTLLRDLDRKGE